MENAVGDDVCSTAFVASGGAFVAVERGIVVACSAGNQWPEPCSVVNTAPWKTNVGARSIERTIPVQVFGHP
ncbi:unnamed protein product [Ilex paraguariensis]|uniref:Uncharacterized protein n=1 Tax=Ilex paraguariensis TaxID=185542 RepID=A0ABC8U278_9AQUA